MVYQQVKFEVRHGRAGLGAEVPSAAPRQSTSFHQKYRTDILQKTIRRYISPQEPTRQGAAATGTSSSVPETAKSKSKSSDIIEID